MNIAILLGAGASFPAGSPSTSEITDQVLTGQGVTRHSSSVYQLESDKPPTGRTLAAKKMTQLIKAEIEYYVTNILNRPVNYEDLFYATQQMYDENMGEIDDHTLFNYTKQIRIKADPIIAETTVDPCERLNSFNELISETCDYISDIVWRMLARDATYLSHLDFITQLHKSYTLTNISTLNHDTHIETFLKQNNIPFSDGFLKPETDVRFWGNEFNLNNKIPFLKLHGSVNWFYVPSNQVRFGYELGIPFKDRHHTKARNPNRGYSTFRPTLLIGTFNKIRSYSSDEFLDLHYQFRKTLRKTDKLIICGYSFGDKGINSELLYWINAQHNRQFIIIHHNPTKLRAGARPAIQKLLQKYTPIFIHERLENIKIDKLRKAIDG